MDLISREDVEQARPVWRNEEVKRETEEATVKAREFSRGWNGCLNEYIKNIKALLSAFEGMTNNEVHKAIFGFELNPRYLVTDDNCIVGGEDCPACPLYNKICNNRNFAEWLDSPYKGVSK